MLKFFRRSLRHPASSLLVSAAPTGRLLLFSSYLTLATLSCPPSFLLPQSLWPICLLYPPVLLGYNWSANTRFSRETTRLVRGGALLVPSASPYNLSFLIHSCLFSDWSRTVSSKFFDTQVASILIEELLLPRHALGVFSRLRCNGHSLLLSFYFFRINKIENPSYSTCGNSSQDTLISFCTVQLRTQHRLLFGNSLVQAVDSCPAFGLPTYPHPSEGVG